ncbi:MAG: hypothetical protein ABIH83_01030 [Candidatus Micrarchaeota archaeon]
MLSNIDKMDKDGGKDMTKRKEEVGKSFTEAITLADKYIEEIEKPELGKQE